MNIDPELKTRTTAFLVLLVALLVVFAGFLGFFRDYPDLFSGKRKEQAVEVSRDIVEKWRTAVLDGDRKNAFLYASQIVPDTGARPPDPVYAEFFESCGQTPSVLTSLWTDADFRRWKSWLAEAARIPAETEGLDGALAALQKAAPDRLFDRAALSGFDVFVVRVMNSDPPRELYEFRKDGVICTMSPSDRKFVQGAAKAALPAGAELIHLYPAPQADYRAFNQELYRRVEPYLGRMPRPPAEGLVECKEKYPDIGAAAFWPDPIRPVARISVKK